MIKSTITELIKIANELDEENFPNEADILTRIATRLGTYQYINGANDINYTKLDAAVTKILEKLLNKSTLDIKQEQELRDIYNSKIEVPQWLKDQAMDQIRKVTEGTPIPKTY